VVVVHIRYGRGSADEPRLDRMKARGKKVKRSKRKRGVGMSFGELIRRLWEPKPEGVEAKVTPGKKRKSAGKGKGFRKR
jgi:hypothetical protein